MSALNRITTAWQLRCPRCREGQLFNGLLSMKERCPRCGLVLEPEPGFYLGSIYANYAATVLLVTSTFLALVYGYGWDKNVVLWACVAFTVIFPLWFFRYARSIWLSLIYFVNSTDFERHDPQSPVTDAEQTHSHHHPDAMSGLPTSTTTQRRSIASCHH